MDAQLKERLELAGLSATDLAWFDSFDCDDARVPVPRPGEIADYSRREAALNAAVKALTFAERGEAPEGRLAAAIGARIADARDPEEEE
ncbi:hypothetical protein [uncultured Rhodoblastus sp.]|uniref:hypothetical protein n=1 Tax=uncultured Rhodoblastus sp. TaxID=543037 RepID=UPI0025ED9E93|nr:hypothetical protein [uncultured Rhodoblastus sp.]